MAPPTGAAPHLLRGKQMAYFKVLFPNGSESIVNVAGDERDAMRAAACRSFWSDDPLNRAYREIKGETFSLKDFTAFIEAMPPEQFLALAFQSAGGSDAR